MALRFLLINPATGHLAFFSVTKLLKYMEINIAVDSYDEQN